MYKPRKVNKKLPLPSLIGQNPPSFVSYMLPSSTLQLTLEFFLERKGWKSRNSENAVLTVSVVPENTAYIGVATLLCISEQWSIVATPSQEFRQIINIIHKYLPILFIDQTCLEILGHLSSL